MSKTSMKERNKAIRKAWEREQQLVQEGRGTRDWTKEQQEDILNPERGKAYDEQGRAFVGQHMKSAAAYPEYQGNPDNIQFLTYDEHFEAHKGNWNNRTNWYYDPVTKEFHDFGEEELVPCKIIELSDSIVMIETSCQGDKIADKAEPSKEGEKEKSVSSSTGTQNTSAKKTSAGNNPTKPTVAANSSDIATSPKMENGFIRGLKHVGRFIANHPVESIEIAGMVIVGGIKLVSAVAGSRNKGSGTSASSPGGSGTTGTPKTDIAAKVADIVDKATRAENDVSGHKQRYHTKDGVIWKDKAPYHRGGKDS